MSLSMQERQENQVYHIHTKDNYYPKIKSIVWILPDQTLNISMRIQKVIF